MKCHFQIFQDDVWVDCASVTLLEPADGNPRTRAIFEYDLHYAFKPHVEPVSLRFPVSAEMQTLRQWPAFIFDLIPQGIGRQYLLGQLGLADNAAADDIVAFLKPHIATQVRQLQALGDGDHGAD